MSKQVAVPGASATRISGRAAWLSVAATASTLILLTSLHVLSPEFDPSWRVVSEYALGRYGLVLSLMFIAWAVSTWALSAALWTQATTRAMRVGLCFLLAAGLGEALGAAFDIRHEIGHGIAGLLGVGGLPVAAVLISLGLRRNLTWRSAGQRLLRLAHLTWVSVLLLIGSLVLMTIQFARVNGGKLPEHAPKVLPAGVAGLDGWADRLLIVAFCLWAGVAALQAIRQSGPTRAQVLS